MKGVQEPDDRRDHANGESRFQPYCDGVFRLLRHQAADVAGDRVADRAIRRR